MMVDEVPGSDEYELPYGTSDEMVQDMDNTPRKVDAPQSGQAGPSGKRLPVVQIDGASPPTQRIRTDLDPLVATGDVNHLLLPFA